VLWAVSEVAGDEGSGEVWADDDDVPLAGERVGRVEGGAADARLRLCVEPNAAGAGALGLAVDRVDDRGDGRRGLLDEPQVGLADLGRDERPQRERRSAPTASSAVATPAARSASTRESIRRAGRSGRAR
jgi:hypothetical protein